MYQYNGCEHQLRQKHCKRGSLKQQLTLFEKYLDNKIQSINDFQNIPKHIEKIESLFDIFHEIQNEIEFITIEDDDVYARECNELEPFLNIFFFSYVASHQFIKIF